MRVDELDEFQGVTPKIVREWLAKLDPAIVPSACIADDIEAVSELCGETPQALLREINPRMRKGCPSNAAIQAHDGPWLELRGVSRMPGVTEFGLDPDQSQREWMEDYCKDALFWPCDRHGNKVRWPTDAEGKLL